MQRLTGSSATVNNLEPFKQQTAFMFDSKLNVGRFCGSPIILTYDDRLCLKATEMPAADHIITSNPLIFLGEPVRKVASF
jgi:hypothetical protein